MRRPPSACSPSPSARRCWRSRPAPDDLPEGGVAVAYIGVAGAWGFVAAGVFAWLRRPDNRTGPLMIAVGLATLAAGLQFSDAALPFVLGGLFDTLIVALLVHLLLAFPSGRLAGRAARVTVAAGYVMATVLHAPQVLLGDEHGARRRSGRGRRGWPRSSSPSSSRCCSPPSCCWPGGGGPRAGSSAAGSTPCCCSAP